MHPDVEPRIWLQGTLVEADETFQVSLTDIDGDPAVTLGAGTSAAVTITDTDAATVAISNPNQAVTEGGTVTFTLTQSALSSVNTVYSYAINFGTASAADISNIGSHDP